MRNLIPILLALVVLSSGCDSAATSTETSAETQPTNCGDLVSHEGYDYSTVQIGDQCWFSENCRYLPQRSGNSKGSETEPHYYVLNYEGAYLVGYNWPAVMTEGICPSGWHIPSDVEWQTMEISLGMSESEAASEGWRGSPVGNDMKSTSGWNNSGNGSNSSGFNAFPSNPDSKNHSAYYECWWSSSECGFNDGITDIMWSDDNQEDASQLGKTHSVARRLSTGSDNVKRAYANRYWGFSARCVRD